MSEGKDHTGSLYQLKAPLHSIGSSVIRCPWYPSHNPQFGVTSTLLTDVTEGQIWKREIERGWGVSRLCSGKHVHKNEGIQNWHSTKGRHWHLWLTSAAVTITARNETVLVPLYFRSPWRSWLAQNVAANSSMSFQLKKSASACVSVTTNFVNYTCLYT